MNEAPSLPSELKNDVYAELLVVPENATTGYNLSYHIIASDDDSDNLTYSLFMDDRTAPFGIRSIPVASSTGGYPTEGVVYVTDGSKLDYETKSSYVGWLNVTDAHGLKS